MWVIGRRDSGTSTCLKCHILREGGIGVWVWEIIWAIKDAMTDIKFSAFLAAVVLFEKFILNWE